MSDIAIRTENVGKSYIIGHETHGKYATLRDIIVGKVKLTVEKTRQLFRGGQLVAGNELEEFWALKNINFEIKQGERIGIIGRNGAGKSTLLKVLSRITEPTTGRVNIKGRVASLLEVGTGFHPELSGRENIFLNGTILGMRRAEIRKNFDEIVYFSGVEKFLDTPVKRYSSGMYVRLAFAVAAHLEPEILVVDEVLSVGDAEFQKKCLGKMEDVSTKEGRTVLFVSHNMGSIKQLCLKSFLLSKGEIVLEGNTNDVINHYLTHKNAAISSGKKKLESKSAVEVYFTEISIINQQGDTLENIKYDEDFFIQLNFTVTEEINSLEVSVYFRNSNNINVLFTSLSDAFNNNLVSLKPGKYSTLTNVRGNLLLPDTYSVCISAHLRNNRDIDAYQDILQFTIVETGSYMAPYGNAAVNLTCILDNCKWNLKKLEPGLL